MSTIAPPKVSKVPMCPLWQLFLEKSLILYLVSLSQSVQSYFFFQILVIVDAKPKALRLPTDAYYSVEEVHDVSP